MRLSERLVDRRIVLCLITFLSMLGATRGTLHAEPVSFRFDARVASSASIRAGASLPVPIQIGDTIKAQFSFEPASGSRFYPQDALLTFEHPNLVLQTTDFQIGVLNDVPGSIELTGRIADPDNTSIVDQGPGPHDGINISCGHNLSPFCGLVAGRDDLRWGANIAFMNEHGLLDSSDLTRGLAMWNTFSFREMSLLFVDAVTSGEVYVGAYVGAVQLIPEPCMLYLAIAVIALLLSLSRQRRGRWPRIHFGVPTGLPDHPGGRTTRSIFSLKLKPPLCDAASLLGGA
jgi:hypothetical protein